MFTGIVEETGVLLSVARGGHAFRLTVGARRILEDIKTGDSISVNGICLTATGFTSSEFTADVMPETLNRSCLGALSTGSRVNLERAMKAGDRFGGHIVSGHIDGTGTITSITRDSNAIWYTIRTSPSILRCIVEKGSIAIDGVSLTVARVTDVNFSVSVIPHTAKHTSLGLRRPGETVNLENDCVGKYIEKFIKFPPCPESPDRTQVPLTMDLLERYGF